MKKNLDKFFEVIGTVAGFSLCLGIALQLEKVISTKSAKDLSLSYLILSLTVGVFWMAYGFYYKRFAIWFTDIILIIIQGALIIFALKFSQ